MSGQIVTVNKSVYYEVHFHQPVVNSGAKPHVLTASKTEYQIAVLCLSLGFLIVALAAMYRIG